MTVNKRRKNSRQRGSWTHGWGAKKKHRGAGHRGGRGNAGSGKRADCKKPSFWEDTKYFGKHGFVKQSKTEKINAINIQTIEDTLPTLIRKGYITQGKGVYVMNLEDLGYNKLLGKGKVVNKLNIKVKYASASAIEKIKKAGGSIDVEKVSSEKSSEKAEEE